MRRLTLRASEDANEVLGLRIALELGAASRNRLCVTRRADGSATKTFDAFSRCVGSKTNDSHIALREVSGEAIMGRCALDSERPSRDFNFRATTLPRRTTQCCGLRVALTHV